jgi:hypothetical protein
VQRVLPYDKPSLSKRAFRFTIGFHSVAPPPPPSKRPVTKQHPPLSPARDPDLLLVHLNRHDFDFYMERHARLRDTYSFSKEELACGRSHHYRTRDKDLEVQFDKECGVNEPMPKWLAESRLF